MDTPVPPASWRRQAAFLAWSAFTLAYLAWRAGYTLNPEAPLYAWGFWALEVYASLCAMAFYATVRERAARAPPSPPAPGVTVDVFVCTYNEALPLLRQTLRRALAMEHPHRTWLLDDGNRPEARALAESLGCGYLARGKNTHFKAGNLNHALSRTEGELVVVLDADHLVRRDFLTRLLGYFEDPAVALVQTPQVFYNVDSFQHHLRASTGQLWHEGAIFHHAMQPGADRWNAAFFVGTGAILRRSALERIGGFATGSVTEDAYTCMRLHAAGYTSVYHDEPLAYLLAPESLLQYLTQRLRWGQGSMQILRRENPLWKRGLTWRQRLVYFMALSSFAQAVVHLAYYVAPALFLLGGPAPLSVDTPLLFLPLVARVGVDLATFRYFLGPLARPLLAECYKFLNVYAYLKALGGLLSSARLKFQVTPKGRDTGASARLLAPQLVLLWLNATAFAVGVLRLVAGGGQTAVGALGLGLATLFSGLFVLIGTMATLFARERLAAESEYTFPDDIPASLRLADGRSLEVTVVRANEGELHAVLPAGVPPPGAGERTSLRLALGEGRVLEDVAGTVVSAGPVRVSGEHAPASLVRVELLPLPTVASDWLFDRWGEHAMPRVIEPLVRRWQSPPSPVSVSEQGPEALEVLETPARPELAPAYFVPLQANVL